MRLRGEDIFVEPIFDDAGSSVKNEVGLQVYAYGCLRHGVAHKGTLTEAQGNSYVPGDDGWIDYHRRDRH